MLDVSVAYNRYKFLGHEFLTWLWFLIEDDPQSLKNSDGEAVVLRLGDRIVLENNQGENLETITIKGSESELEEGRIAVKRGAVVTELNLLLHYNQHLWRFDIKGESLDLSGLKLPETEQAPTDDKEATLLERIDLYEIPLNLVHHLYKQFIALRIAPDWPETTLPRIKAWMTKS